MKLNHIYQGDCLDVMRTWPDELVDCCITSPPYWGLRNYGDNRVIWNGKKDCVHEWIEYEVPGISGGTNSSKVKVKGKENFQITPPGTVGECEKCGAMFCELGREPTPELYVQHLCDIFDGIRPKLAEWGSMYINLGDFCCR